MIKTILDITGIVLMAVAIFFKPRWFSTVAGMSAVEVGTLAVFDGEYSLAFANFNAALAWLAVLILERKYEPYTSND